MFGQSIQEIQHQLIRQLPTQGSLLLLGGGDGSILPLLYSHAPLLEIEYLEASSKMIELAKQQAHSSQKIVFNHNADFSTHKEQYDFIYTAFFLDQFTVHEIGKIIQRFKQSKTQWFVADFYLGENTRRKLWRNLQIKMSIIFFKCTTNHQVQNLPDVFKVFHELGFKSSYISTLGGGFYRLEIFKP